MTDNFTEETLNYVKGVKQYLVDTYGSIKDSWKPLLKMLATEYDLYLHSQEAIKSNGILIQTAKGMIANPAIKVSHDSLIQVQKLIQELGASPKMEVKLKVAASTDDDDDFLSNLTK